MASCWAPTTDDTPGNHLADAGAEDQVTPMPLCQFCGRNYTPPPPAHRRVPCDEGRLFSAVAAGALK